MSRRAGSRARIAQIAALAALVGSLGGQDATLAATTGPVAGPASLAVRPSALVVLLAAAAADSGQHADDRLERMLQSIPGLSIAIISSRQGDYTWQRLRRDLAQASGLAGRTETGSGDSSTRPRLRILRLPTSAEALRRLRALAARRGADELILVLEQARSGEGHELLWAAVAGLGPGGQTLTSQSTEQRGLIAAIDVVPTLLGHLRLPVPAGLHGRPIKAVGVLDGAGLRSLKARLEVLYPRRLPALAWLLAACALTVAAAQLTRGGVRRAVRVSALALLFAPLAMLVPAALAPSAAAEYVLIAGVALALAALADALLAWPRALLAPALATVVAFALDALAGTQLLIRSLLGPNPAYGSRFYGIGNELKSALAVLVFAAVAAALHRDPVRPVRSRRAAGAMAGAGALLAAIEGSARIGAGVGGAILVCAGAAVATGLLLPTRPSRACLLAGVLATPLLGLALLAAIDLATARGAGHFTGSVLEAGSLTELGELIGRRYEAAWQELGNGAMPLATALALVASVAAVRRRDRLLAVVGGDPAWLAALAGGLTAGIAGALSEDSGPLLLVSAVSALACVLAYLQATPAGAGARKPRDRPTDGTTGEHRLPSLSMCVGCAMAAASAASGLRTWLQTHGFSWLTPKRLRAVTVTAMCAAGLVSTVGVSGSTPPSGRASEHAQHARSRATP